MNRLCKHLGKNFWYINLLLCVLENLIEAGIVSLSLVCIWNAVILQPHTSKKTESFLWGLTCLRGEEFSKTKIC